VSLLPNQPFEGAAGKRRFAPLMRPLNGDVRHFELGVGNHPI